MKITFRLIFNIMLFLSLLLLAAAYPQPGEQKPKRSIDISFAEAECIDTVYRVSFIGFRIPSQQYYYPSGWVYRIRLTVLLHGDDFTWDKPIEVRCVLPDDKVETLLINTEGEVLDSRIFNYVCFTLETKKKGYAELTLSEHRISMAETKEESSISFSGKSVWLH